jgi:hypothetical protein
LFQLLCLTSPDKAQIHGLTPSRRTRISLSCEFHLALRPHGPILIEAQRQTPLSEWGRFTAIAPPELVLPDFALGCPHLRDSLISLQALTASDFEERQP